MKYEISQRFFFDAAHTLERRIETEGSARVHGHTYQGEVAVAGEPDASGMVVDLGHLRRALGELRDKLDHQLLDDVPGLGKPTLENLCRFVADHARAAGFPVSRVSIWREGIGDRCDLRLA
ncbi:MAG TPA: 6-carboxytetrahydropterin synthase [Ramlibacter sp.]|uniref:6-carboxytetrahydropterin synthase n=1 Tax=Ramlibacter sp. TaxID=1917967 RepID=UPI002ED10CE3